MASGPKALPKALIAGNWKMNGLAASGQAEAADLVARVRAAPVLAAEVAVCPPATLLAVLAPVFAGSPVGLGGQDCHVAASGAHTGDVSAAMLRDAGCRYVIVGHSERRADHGERAALVRAKAEAAHRAGLTAIVCVGESRAEREAGRAVAVVTADLAASLPDGTTAENTVVAYEPVWAIGTGLTPTVADIAEMHGALRRALLERFGAPAAGVRLLYGGSVKAGNAGEILAVADVNGALVGGASLKTADFWPIVAAIP